MTDNDLGECPTCRASCPVLMPAEPEVGIFTVLYECKEHGPFYFEAGEAHFLAEAIAMGAGSEAEPKP